MINGVKEFLGLVAIVLTFVACIAYLKKSDCTITGTDWIFFGAAMSSLPLWYVTSDPLAAVILLSVMEVLGFAPTLRKAYRYPFDEGITFFALFIARNLIAIIALENYSWTTILFPAVTAFASAILIFVIVYRRITFGASQQE